MLFSRVQFEDYYDEDKILKMYDLVSKKFDNVELIWKHNLKKVDDFSASNKVQIKANGKNLFMHQNINDRGLLYLGNADNHVKDLLIAFKDSGLSVSSNLGNAYLGPIVYVILLVVAGTFIYTDRDEELAFFIWFMLAFTIGGALMYIRSFKHFVNSEFALANFSSIVLMIGILFTAPSSLLLMSFLSNLNRSQFGKLLDNLD